MNQGQCLSLFLAVTLAAQGCAVSRPESLVRQPAQSDASDQAKMAEELLRRWSETKVPDFLEGKKSDPAEVSEVGLRIEPEILRRILASDSEQPKTKVSEMPRSGVYSSLQHQSKLQYLVQNLTAGELKPRASEVHYSRNGVYLELHRAAEPRPFEWGDVEFHFDFSVLDRRDYHVNPSWAYGNYDPDSASPAVNMGRMQYYLREHLVREGTKNEFVFDGPVGFKDLVRIVVPKGKKKALLRELSQKKLASPNSLSWEQLIAEQAMPPKKPQPSDPSIGE